MKIEFNNDDKNKKINMSEMKEGNFEDMIKLRKKQLPKLQESIQEILKDYHGRGITIIVQHVDENGNPDHSAVLMAGVSTIESQVAMVKTLRDAAHQGMELLMDSSKGDVQQMLAVANALVNLVGTRGKK